MLYVDDHCRGLTKAKHLQTSQAIWDEINLISLRAEKLAQSLL